MHAAILVLLILTDEVGFSMAAPASDVTAVSHKEQKLDGQGLAFLGEKLNNPYLKVVGVSLVNTFARLCELIPCGEWSEWSRCSAVWDGQFGVRNRTRKCGEDEGFCKAQHRKVTTELEKSLCEVFCPAEYNFTSEGFCLKYIHQKVTQADAEKSCLDDGGFLVNINSQIKSNSVTKMISELPISYAFWVDGQRTDTKSQWQFSYESDITGFTNWHSSEPSNGSTELCNRFQKFSSEEWKRCDGSCLAMNYFVCEKVIS